MWKNVCDVECVLVAGAGGRGGWVRTGSEYSSALAGEEYTKKGGGAEVLQ